MKSVSSTIICLLAMCLSTASASVFLPHDVTSKTVGPFSKDFSSSSSSSHHRTTRRSLLHPGSSKAAMAIPGNGVTEQIFVGGFANFLSIYNIVVTGRILLTWIPQTQGVAALQPVYAITDPFLNLFRGIIPPIAGIDLSPLAAFFLLNVLTNVTAAVGAEIPAHLQEKMKRSKFGVANARGRAKLGM
mmetsp:Transcript_36416/g.51482  ORF Transcript_36416/g.51482 Transcript_36416/m.51482 type:complete len:188 (+) Transcript_36416:74-637(+)|eukprot:CAMPEP_0202442994 /NCGR_PEP_ID=MMETSP1360-20130828/2358_1 /ASSEMBLY_ACC=CAM_ASM_000848 /TAXON_ID=515479 /ORGANISM="Licmophora paradoxa, Strain CCMP2313" /LENGTH=187 /DNA_ID=CAMNT_0049058551 /DNA_START=39 /DNA_END=602 /DNA_ORIENTATION=-